MRAAPVDKERVDGVAPGDARHFLRCRGGARSSCRHVLSREDICIRSRGPAYQRRNSMRSSAERWAAPSRVTPLTLQISRAHEAQGLRRHYRPPELRPGQDSARSHPRPSRPRKSRVVCMAPLDRYGNAVKVIEAEGFRRPHRLHGHRGREPVTSTKSTGYGLAELWPRCSTEA